jgi:hypothetical protein
MRCPRWFGLAAIAANRVHGSPATDDTFRLATLTHVPGAVWIMGWLALIGWSPWRAVPLLWR